MSEQAAAPRRTLRRRLERHLRELDRRAGRPDRTRRLRDLLGDRYPWWDWGHRLMILTGRDDGNWSPPRAPDLYWRVGWARREDRTAIEGSENERLETRDAMTAWDGVHRGEEWRTFDWQDDGHTLRVGWLGDDGRIHDSSIGESQGEMARFRRWFIWESWVKTDWLGLRPWLYYRGLSHAVDHREPLSCGLTPPRGTGAYSHWHCTVRRPLWAVLTGRRTQHGGLHRFRNYTWDERQPGARVDYAPVAPEGWRLPR